MLQDYLSSASYERKRYLPTAGRVFSVDDEWFSRRIHDIHLFRVQTKNVERWQLWNLGVDRYAARLSNLAGEDSSAVH